MAEAHTEATKADAITASEVGAVDVAGTAPNETSEASVSKTEVPEKAENAPETENAVKDESKNSGVENEMENGRKRHVNKSKYDPSVLSETDDHALIRRQVEFYFGNSNLAVDDFLYKQLDGSKNNPVKLDIILTFGRMKRFKSKEAVVAALKESKIVKVEGEEGKEVVNRIVPYDANIAKAGATHMERSIYAKGFGPEDKGTQFDIEAFFSPYGPTESVRLRRTPDKTFKGSVFVEFSTKEDAEKFLALEPKPLWKGEALEAITSKKAYVDQKNQDILDGKIQPSQTWVARGGRGGLSFENRGRGSRGRGDRGDNRGGNRGGDRDPDDWKKRREDDRSSGFKNRGGKGDKRGGRGGRAGRGGRGRGDRGPRDRNNERSGDKEDKSEVKTEAVAESNDKKRPREDDGGGEPAAKKVDVKSEVAAAS